MPRSLSCATGSRSCSATVGCSGSFDVSVTVGAGGEHPSLSEHHVRYIALYKDTAEIARVYLHPVFSAPRVTFTIALDEETHRKARIRAAGATFDLPSPDELESRIATVCTVLYLVFTEGHTASAGEAPVRVDLSAEAVGKVIVRKAELAVIVEGPELKFAGTDAAYSVVIQNTGNAAADIGLQFRCIVRCGTRRRLTDLCPYKFRRIEFRRTGWKPIYVKT